MRKIKIISYYSISILLLLLLIMRSTLFKVEWYNILYYLIFSFLNFYFFYLIFSNPTKINFKLFFLLIVCLISLVFNQVIGNINPVLNSWQRFVTFLLAIVLVGPLFINNEIQFFRRVLFKTSLILIVLFFLFNLIIVIRMDSISFEGYNGIMESQILLGSLAALSMIFFLFFFVNENNKKRKFFYFLLFLISIPGLLLSASRSAILSLLFVLFLFFLLNFRKGFPLFVVFICLGLLFNKQLDIYSQVLIQKMEKRNDSGDITAGRAGIYSDNLLDFKSNPIIGSGFYNVINSKNSKINDDGSLEYSSGWLFVLSSTGLLGFLFFINLILTSFKKIFISRFFNINKYEMIACYFMIFFVVHSNFEGYIYSAGGLMFFVFWLSFSIVTSINFNENTTNFSGR